MPPLRSAGAAEEVWACTMGGVLLNVECGFGGWLAGAGVTGALGVSDTTTKAVEMAATANKDLASRLLAIIKWVAKPEPVARPRTALDERRQNSRLPNDKRPVTK